MTDRYADLAELALETKARIMPGMDSGRDGTEGPLALASSIAFGDVWNRPHLNVRDRRLLTLGVLGVVARDSTIAIHVRAALRHGDLSPDDLNEFVTHFGLYAGFPLAAGLNRVVQSEIASFREVADN